MKLIRWNELAADRKKCLKKQFNELEQMQYSKEGKKWKMKINEYMGTNSTQQRDLKSFRKSKSMQK